MGLVSQTFHSQRVLAYCDGCDGVLLPRHHHTPRTFRACAPVDIEPLFLARDELVAIAQDAGWIASADGKWTCNGCKSPIALAPASTNDESRLRGVTVLIAEDHADSREVLRWYLDESGATCVESSSGSEAFDAFNRSRPDVLLADLWMPEVDGLELIRRIRALPSEHGRLTPAIAVSAQGNEEQALMAGYHALIRKPYDPPSVVRMVEEFIRAESGAPGREASWTVVSHEPGTVEMTFVGQVGAPEVKAAIEVLLGYLETEPRRVEVDLRRVTAFSAAAGSAAQRAVWAKRFAIRHVHIIGGPTSVRVVASATCRLLGLGCSVERGEAVT